MARQRLSMKLLWKQANDYSKRPDAAYNHQNVIDFLNYVEQDLAGTIPLANQPQEN